MMYLNITSAKMVNNYADLIDTSTLFVGNEFIIDQTFDIKRLGLSGSGNFTININPISTNIGAVGDPISFSNFIALLFLVLKSPTCSPRLSVTGERL